MIDLSVHLITYNNEKHIEDTLQSILMQKVDFTFEIVVGDDCSTDKTLDIITTYTLAHPKIFKITKNDTQLGILGNFKATLDNCSGTYVFDIAGDDMLKTDDALQKMVTALQSNPNSCFVYSGFDRLDDNSLNIESFKNKKIIYDSKEAFKKQVLLGKVNPMPLCYKRTCLYKYVDFKNYLKMGLTIEDYPIFVDLIMQTNFAVIKESLHIYRVHSNSFTHQKSLKKHLLFKTEIKKIFFFFSEKYNFSQQFIDEYTINHNKEILFLAGYFKNKELGKQIFSKINQKSLKDYIHYFASQQHWVRHLIAFRKRILGFK